MTLDHQERWKREMVEHVRDLGFTVAVTLAWNSSNVPLPVAKDHLRHLHAIVDRKLYGRHYNRMPRRERTLALFAFEGLGSHLHAHSLWRVQGLQNLWKFSGLFTGERGGAWNRLASGGSYKLSCITDPVAYIGYALKKQHAASAEAELVWSDEFVAARR